MKGGISMKRYVLVLLGFLLFNTPVFPQNDSIKIYPDNDYVYYIDAAFQQDTDEKWNKSTTGSFYLPFINVDNEDIQMLNKTLEKLYFTFYPYAVNQANESKHSYVLEAKQFINQNTLSILIKFYRYSNYSNLNRNEYTLMPVIIDLKENRLLSQTEVLNKSGYTLNEVVDYIENKLRLLGYAINDNYGNEVYDQEAYSWYKQVFLINYSLNPYAVPYYIQLFLDDNKNLNVLVPINKIASNKICFYESFILPAKEGLK